MADYDYDLFVIGAGSGGVRAARVAAAHGAKVAVAEEYRVGGTCVIRGCVPKKLLVYGAHFAEDLKDARRFGWDVPDCDVRLDDAARQRARGSRPDQRGLYRHARQPRRRDHPRTRRPSPARNDVTLASGREVTAKYILIATGARPHMPDLPGARTRHHLERGVPPRRRAQAHPDRGRGLYRQRIRRHLPRIRRAR